MTIRFLHCTIQVRRTGPNPFQVFWSRASELPVSDEPGQASNIASGARGTLPRSAGEVYAGAAIRARTSVAAAWPAAVM